MLANPATGDLTSLDGTTGAVLARLQLPLRPGQSHQPREPFNPGRTRNAAILAPDGKTLFVVDNRGLSGGVWAVDPVSLKPKDLLFDGHTISAVAAAASSSLVFGLSRIEKRIYTSTGGVRPDPADAIDFVRPGSVASGE